MSIRRFSSRYSLQPEQVLAAVRLYTFRSCLKHTSQENALWLSECQHSESRYVMGKTPPVKFFLSRCCFIDAFGAQAIRCLAAKPPNPPCSCHSCQSACCQACLEHWIASRCIRLGPEGWKEGSHNPTLCSPSTIDTHRQISSISHLKANPTRSQ